jgi:uncharacterized repeat protein (TIGR01451 family)
VTGNQADLNPGNDLSTVATTVLPIRPIRADLAVTQTDTPDPGAVADPLVYTLTTTNHGPSTATGVQVTDNLSPGVALAGPEIPSQGTCEGPGPVVCHLGTFASGASATVTINVLPPPGWNGQQHGLGRWRRARYHPREQLDFGCHDHQRRRPSAHPAEQLQSLGVWRATHLYARRSVR